MKSTQADQKAVTTPRSLIQWDHGCRKAAKRRQLLPLSALQWQWEARWWRATCSWEVKACHSSIAPQSGDGKQTQRQILTRTSTRHRLSIDVSSCCSWTRRRRGERRCYLCTELGLGYSDDEFHHGGDLRLQRRNHVNQSCELLGGAFPCNTHRHTCTKKHKKHYRHFQVPGKRVIHSSPPSCLAAAFNSDLVLLVPAWACVNIWTLSKIRLSQPHAFLFPVNVPGKQLTKVLLHPKG